MTKNKARQEADTMSIRINQPCYVIRMTGYSKWYTPWRWGVDYTNVSQDYLSKKQGTKVY